VTLRAQHIKVSKRKVITHY